MSRDPLVDIRTLPEDVLRVLGPDARGLTSKPFERRIPFTRLKLSRDPLVRASELLATFRELTEIAATAERVARQQAAQIEAESGLAVVKGHASGLKERLASATEAQAKFEQQLDRARHEIAAQKQQIAALVAEKRATDQRIDGLARERDRLASQIQQGTAAREAYLASFADLQHRLSKASVERAHLEEEVQRATVTKQAYLGTITDLQRRLGDRVRLENELAAARAKTATLGADNAALRRAAGLLTIEKTELSERFDELTVQMQMLAAQVEKLDAEADELNADAQEHFVQRQRLEEEKRRWKAQAQGDAHAAGRLRAENATLQAKNAQLAAERQVLVEEVEDRRVVEQRLRDDNRRWRAQARGEIRTAARDHAWAAGLLAARWAHHRCAA